MVLEQDQYGQEMFTAQAQSTIYGSVHTVQIIDLTAITVQT